MSLALTAPEVDALHEETEQHRPPTISSDGLEAVYSLPSLLGHGYSREIELCPGLDLEIFHHTLSDEFVYRGIESPHLVQFMVHLSGVVDSGSALYQDADYSYIGGSGIQRATTTIHAHTQPLIGVNIHLDPQLLRQLFATPTGELPPELQPLIQGDDWQRVFSPRVTGVMRKVVQQMMDCPFVGMTKRLYLQSKVFELMVLQLDGMAPAKTAAAGMPKAETLARIHYAAEILRSHLENPPSLTALAQQVGVSDRTLQKGFKAVFGVTPFAYLRQQRMYQARHLLRQADYSVAEVANMLGYANPAQFAVAFKRQFGTTPSGSWPPKGMR